MMVSSPGLYVCAIISKIWSVPAPKEKLGRAEVELGSQGISQLGTVSIGISAASFVQSTIAFAALGEQPNGFSFEAKQLHRKV